MGPVEVVVGGADGIAVDAGIVDQRVEHADISLDPLTRRVDGRLVGYVEPDRLDSGDAIYLVGIPRPAEDQEAMIGRQLARDLRADAAAHAADERNAAIRSHNG